MASRSADRRVISSEQAFADAVRMVFQIGGDRRQTGFDAADNRRGALRQRQAEQCQCAVGFNFQQPLHQPASGDFRGALVDNRHPRRAIIGLAEIRGDQGHAVFHF